MKPPLKQGAKDDFQTPPSALDPLYEFLKPHWTIWECATGNGNLAWALRRKGFKVISTDILSGHDFLKYEPKHYDCIITNPPFSLKQEFLQRAYCLDKPFAFLLPLTTLESAKRQFLFRCCGLELILFDHRINFETPDGEGAGSWFATAWFTNRLKVGKELTFVAKDEAKKNSCRLDLPENYFYSGKTSLIFRNFVPEMTPIIYLDNNATTKIDPRVLEAMMPFLTEVYANAASTHPFGIDAHEAVKKARIQVSELIGSEVNEIVFTSGATEAINLAIKGVTESYREKGKHIVTITTEHSAVLDTCKYLEENGYEITYLPVKTDGLLDLNIVKSAVREDTILVSVMFANNETGVIQPIKEIAEIAHLKGAFFMTDATQVVGKIPINVNDLDIDLMPFSGHKFYGPKGVGALFVRGRKPNKVKLNAMLHGGGHEKGLRSGTLNVPGIVGLGKAAEIAKSEMTKDAKRVGELRDYLEKELLKIENTSLNGNSEKRLYNTSNICFKGADSDAMIIDLKGIAVSNGSACTSASIEPSHVLKSIGLSDEDAFASLRFSLGRFNTREEIQKVILSLPNAVKELRAMKV